MKFLEEIYPRENYVNPNGRRFGSWCCKRGGVRVAPIGNRKEWKRETTEEAFEMLLARHLDLKNFFQLCQDLEIIRRVDFSQRHVVLSSLITLEAEKRVVDLMGRDRDLVQKSETGDLELFQRSKKKTLDIQKSGTQDVAPDCDRKDGIFGEQSSISEMVQEKMKECG